DADQVLVCDVYPAGEQPISGADAPHLTDAIREHGHHRVGYVPDRGALIERLCEDVQEGDVIIALGAGDINKMLKPLGARLREIFERPTRPALEEQSDG